MKKSIEGLLEKFLEKIWMNLFRNFWVKLWRNLWINWWRNVWPSPCKIFMQNLWKNESVVIKITQKGNLGRVLRKSMLEFWMQFVEGNWKKFLEKNLEELFAEFQERSWCIFVKKHISGRIFKGYIVGISQGFFKRILRGIFKAFPDRST